MHPTVAEQTTRVIPPVTVPTAQAVKLASQRSRGKSRHRMQRAARIYAGTLNLGDKLATYPDKGWALMLLVGVAFTFTGVGYAVALVAESVF